MELKRQLGVSYPTSWKIKHKGTSKNQEFNTYSSLKKTPCGAKGSNKLHIKTTKLNQAAS